MVRKWLWVALAVAPGLLCLAALAYAQTNSFRIEIVGQDSATAHESESLDVMSTLFVFVLASFIGMGVIRRVSRLLHTPLMSLTNAISAIAIVGAILVAGSSHYPTSIRIMGVIAVFASMTNIVSGFLITNRMLKMFKTRDRGNS